MHVRPAYYHNKSVTHNLMKRSLGLPHIFHITNCCNSPVTVHPPPQLRTSRVARLPSADHPQQELVRHTSHHQQGFTGSCEGPVTHSTRHCSRKVPSPHPLGNYSSRRLALSMKPGVAEISFTKLLKTEVMHPVSAPLPANTNKVFSSTWLDDNHVLLGTKCHKLLVYNVNNHHFDYIETLSGDRSTSSGRSGSSLKHPPNCFGGMRSIAVNLSRTLVATCGRDCSSVAVYHFPSMVPLVLAQGVLTDWIFGMSWLSETKLAVGSRDGRMTIWDFTCHFNSVPQNKLPAERKANSFIVAEYGDIGFDNGSLPNGSQSTVGGDCFCDDASKSLGYAVTSKCTFDISCGSKVRAVECCSDRDIVALISRGQLNFYDIHRMSKPQCITIPGGDDNTCMTYDHSRELLAVGSCKETYLLDVREQEPIIMTIPLPSHESAYVRSLCFCENFLSIGTGTSGLHFLDVRYCNRQKVAYYDTYFTTGKSNSLDDDHLNANIAPPYQRSHNTSRLHNNFRVVNSTPLRDTESGRIHHGISYSLFPRIGPMVMPSLMGISLGERYMGEQSPLGRAVRQRHMSPLVCSVSEVAVGRIGMDDEGDYGEEEEAVYNASNRGLSNGNTSEYRALHRILEDRFSLNNPVQSYFNPENPFPTVNENQISIYTHCFNKNKSMIFTAGGSLAAFEDSAFCTVFV